MGLADFFSDIFASVAVRDVHAEAGEASPSNQLGEHSNTGAGSGGGAQQRGDASVTGGASSKSPAGRSAQNMGESDEEADVNKADAEKAASKSGEQPAGQKPGEGAQAAAGKYQPTDPNAEDPVGGDDEPADEDEEEDEPADPMPKIQEGA